MDFLMFVYFQIEIKGLLSFQKIYNLYYSALILLQFAGIRRPYTHNDSNVCGFRFIHCSALIMFNIMMKLLI